ncbi:MAG: gliding motility protein GldM [Bacteroidetes bacterium]|nr:gliding motility protein GldM [Bacteroidota bacterium]
MAGGKQTPRQKMIGLMYLVFISLMALNVSVTVMDSFVLIDDGIKRTNLNFTKRVDDVYREFRQQMALAPEKVEPYYKRAMKVQELTDSVVTFIKFHRSDMISRLDKIPMEKADTLSLLNLKTKSQYSKTSAYWIKDGNQDMLADGGQGTKAYALRKKIEDYKQSVTNILLELVPQERQERFLEGLQLGIDTEGPFLDNNGKEISWQRSMFDRVIPIAIATNLSRLVTEVKNAEFEVVSRLYSEISAEDFSFDKIEARVVPRSQIVMLGDHYEADIFVAAYDTKQKPTIVVDGRSIEAKDGVGKYRVPASAIGSRSFKGEIQVPHPVSGQMTPYPFKGDYIVQRPSVTVSADAMNVFYVGVDNPVTISVPGVANENIRAVISSGGSLIPRGDGKFTVRMTSGTREAKITVSALMDGGTRPMGSAEFRVRPIPNPTPKVAGLNSGAAVARERLQAVPRVTADPEGFDFEAKFEIISFTMYTIEAGDLRPYNARGGTFSNEMITAIGRGRRGQVFTFSDIIARGPDNTNRPLSAVVLKLD